MKKNTIIILVIVFVIIIIAVVAFLIYRNNRKKKEQEAQQQMAILQQQLAQNPEMPAQEKGNLLGQIANLAAIIGQIRGGTKDNSGPLPGLGGAGWNPEPSGFPLKKGSVNSYVTTLQKAINTKCSSKMKSMGMLPLTTDGKFGPLTEKAAAACVGANTVSWQKYQEYIA